MNRLLQVCEAAIVVAQETGDVGGVARWQDRIQQIKAGQVSDARFAAWLKCSADYWGPKDREYAEALVKLARTL